MSTRGIERERSLDMDVYYSDGYFKLEQLCSFAHQIHDIYKLKPRTILEIGIGNGFTSTILKKSGFDVTTADINESLGPDICAPIDSLRHHLHDRKFDLVVCCEVLEHLPFNQFEKSIEIFRSLSDSLYLTLPSYSRIYGFGGFFRLPKREPSIGSWLIKLPGGRVLDKEHFWEVSSSRASSLKQIKSILEKYYNEVDVSYYHLNPYHISFSCSSP